jgi:hypothetical protein
MPVNNGSARKKKQNLLRQAMSVNTDNACKKGQCPQVRSKSIKTGHSHEAVH